MKIETKRNIKIKIEPWMERYLGSNARNGKER